MQISSQENYDLCYNANCNDAYGRAILTFATRWADLMEAYIMETHDKDFHNFADKLSFQADEEGLTGYMFSCAVAFLRDCWIYGKELAAWDSAKWGR